MDYVICVLLGFGLGLLTGAGIMVVQLGNRKRRNILTKPGGDRRL